MVISRTSGEDRAVFGTVLFGRMKSGPGAHNTMGLFINTLPIRVDLNGSVHQSVLRTHDQLASLLDHEHASLNLAQQCSGVPHGTPLFNSILNYRHNDTSTDVTSNFPGIELVDCEERTNYPISLSIEDYGASLGVTADVIAPLDPIRICGYMEQALQSLAEAIDLTTEIDASGLEVLPMEEQELLLKTWNATDKEYPDHLCIHHLFEQQAERTPEATALVFMDQSLTYRQLNERSNRLAHHLIGLGVQPETLVAICVDRSIAMIVGVLAILKAGGAYVPLDPAYPTDRLVGILEDFHPSIVLADDVGRATFSEVNTFNECMSQSMMD
jgi:non-ribosomal peptide synthetase component F